MYHQGRSDKLSDTKAGGSDMAPWIIRMIVGGKNYDKVVPRLAVTVFGLCGVLAVVHKII